MRISFTPLFLLLIFCSGSSAFACPVSSTGCDTPRPDTAFLFLSLSATGKDEAATTATLDAGAAKLQNTVKGLQNAALKISLSGISRKAPDSYGAVAQGIELIRFGAVQVPLSQSADESVRLNALANVIDTLYSSG